MTSPNKSYSLSDLESEADKLVAQMLGTTSLAEAESCQMVLQGLADAARIKRACDLRSEWNVGVSWRELPVPPPACGAQDQTGEKRCVKGPRHGGLHTDGLGTLWSTQPPAETATLAADLVALRDRLESEADRAARESSGNTVFEPVGRKRGYGVACAWEWARDRWYR